MKRHEVLLLTGLVLLVLVAVAVPWPQPAPVPKGSASTSGQSTPTRSNSPEPPQPDATALFVPSFQQLPLGTWQVGTKNSVRDLSGVDTASLELARQLYQAPFPAHTCSLGTPSADVDELEGQAERYVECLMNPWQQWAMTHGAAALQTPVVQHCGRPEHAGGDGCSEPDTFFGRAGQDNVIHLASRARPPRYDSFDLEMVIAHELSHCLQFQLRPRAGGELVLLMGVADPDPKRLSRRSELQVECMSVGIVAQSQGGDMVQRKALERLYRSDDVHWDRTSQRFWTQQAARNRVGDCNAHLASDALLMYRSQE
ncbi:hypothetical protein ACTQ49_11990 [Luteococcus sp. Sow4_B9]|uniref:hypothetical protein n=1 Tax=Luteococcus sp. Sow4_B9 TaxID=3438792 RepID=UPI003F974230